MQRKKVLAVYGSTGSIGTNTLAVSKRIGLRIDTLVCKGSNVDKFAEQIIEYNPKYAAIADESNATQLERMIHRKSVRTKIVAGTDEAIRVSIRPEIDLVVMATVGFSGVKPTISCLENGKNVALANKETLVAAGELVMKLARRYRLEIFPIDSEHNTIWRCIEGEASQSKRSHSVIWEIQQGRIDNPIKGITLTASGGPFYNKSRKWMENATVKDALNHPTWKMGRRITIDSATLMNKGFEVIEAMRLYCINIDEINVAVHRTSEIHSFVRFKDNGIKLMIEIPDMKNPIQYALTYPHILENDFKTIDPTYLDLKTRPVDMKKFGCLALAYEAGRTGGTAPAMLNGADEAAVGLFLDGKMGFLDIEKYIRSTMQDAANYKIIIQNPNLEQIEEADGWARYHVEVLYQESRCLNAMKLRRLGTS